jgi:tRNA(fMet)-specific endonuclease VapC
MTIYFLDTSIIIEYLRNKTETVDLVNNLPGPTSSSTICLAELYEGVYHSSQATKNKKAIDHFFEGLNFVYEVNSKVANRFGEIRAKLRRSGNRIEDLDIFIAATCFEHGCTLLTRNTKHFSRIDNISLLDLT